MLKGKWYHSYEMSRTGKSTEIESRLVVASGQGGADGEMSANGYRVSSGSDKMYNHHHNLRTTLNILKAAELYPLDG